MPPFAVLFEDEALLIVEKPAGIHSVALDNEAGGHSLADELLARFPGLREAAERPGDAGLIQRLDFGTSGVMIAAKSRPVWDSLRADIQAGRIHKTYYAVVEGELPAEASVDNFIGSPYRRAQKVRVYDAPPKRGRVLAAHSRFVRRAVDADANISLAMVEAPTARRHQVRVHARTLGHALIGDVLYGSTRRLDEIFSGLDETTAGGFCLHAGFVELLHPLHRRKLAINAPAPEFLRQRFSETALRGERSPAHPAAAL